MNVGSALNTLGKSMIGQGMAFIKTRVGAVVGVPLVAMGSLVTASGYIANATLMAGGVVAKASLLATKKAKDRASVIASALGDNLDGISNISTTCSTNNYNPPRL